MQTILPVQTEVTANGEGGLVCNMLRTMAQSPGALEGYIQFKRALDSGVLSAKIREQIALAVAQTNLCEYSLAQHAHQAAQLGLTIEQILASREARSADGAINAVLRFARKLAAHGGDCSLVELRETGYSDAEIIEVIAHVALNVFENYLNDVALTELDFPRIARPVRAA